MKTKIAFLALLLFATLTLCGQQAATVPMKVTTTQQVAESSPSFKDIKQLQDENLRLKDDLKKLEKEVDKCREDATML